MYSSKLIGSHFVFDIETEPQEWESIEKIAKPFNPPAKPAAFDPSSVKLGNIKNEDLRAQKIESARELHSKQVADYEAYVERAREEWKAKLLDNALLDPMFGRVLAIGYRDTSGNVLIDHGDEVRVINRFWSLFFQVASLGGSLVGHYTRTFDVIFLMRRVWILGYEVPDCVRSGRHLSSVFVDTHDIFEGNAKAVGSCSLDSIARAFGVGAKTEGVTGLDFHRLYHGSEEDRARALEYLANDLELAAAIASRMGLFY